MSCNRNPFIDEARGVTKIAVQKRIQFDKSFFSLNIGDDSYYYRIDRRPHTFEELAFRLARPSEWEDIAAFEGLVVPEGQAIYRLSWFCDWATAADGIVRYIFLDEPKTLTRIKKEILHSLGFEFVGDPCFDDKAVHAYVIEPENEERLSTATIPFELTEYWDNGWHSAAPKDPDPEPVPRPKPSPFTAERFEAGALLCVLAKGVTVFDEPMREADRHRFPLHVRRALEGVGIKCQNTSGSAICETLFFVIGEGPSPDPTALSTDLLNAACYERRRCHRPWLDGEEVLEARRVVVKSGLLARFVSLVTPLTSFGAKVD